MGSSISNSNDANDAVSFAATCLKQEGALGVNDVVCKIVPLSIVCAQSFFYPFVIFISKIQFKNMIIKKDILKSEESRLLKLTRQTAFFTFSFTNWVFFHSIIEIKIT